MSEYQAFLEELTALTLKHGLVIGGCGCLGSPWIAEIEEGEKTGHSYNYNEKVEFAPTENGEQA